jgi:RND superfamily putative drug exporter
VQGPQQCSSRALDGLARLPAQRDQGTRRTNRRHHRGRRARQSRDGRTITGVALIKVVVFAGFAAGQLVMFQQMAFGVGVSLLVEAT